MLHGNFMSQMGGVLAAIGRRGAASCTALVAGAVGYGATAPLVVLDINPRAVGPKAFFDARRCSPIDVVLLSNLRRRDA